jgi:ABC-type glycerol-3-phosphate transport system substrate-binding protein
MKRISASLLAFSLIGSLFLSGCNTGKTASTKSSVSVNSSASEIQNSDATSSTSSTSSQTASTALGKSSSIKSTSSKATTAVKEITIWTQANAQYTFFTWVKKEFELKNPTIKLRITAQTSGQLGVSLDAKLGSKDAPDITATWGGLVVPILIKGKRILPLDDVITPTLEATFNDAAKYNKNDSADGKYYMAPLHGFASPVIFFNKTEFNKLLNNSAVSEPQKAAIRAAIDGTGPNTLDQLELIAKGIRAAGKSPLIGGFNTAPLSHFMQAIHARTMTSAQYNATMVKSKTVNPFDNDGFKKGFDLLKEYNTRGIFADRITGFSDSNAKDDFYSKKSLMLVGLSLDLKDHRRGLPTDDIGVFMLPRDASNTSGPRASGVYSDGFVINANCKNSVEAKKVIEFILSKDAQSKLYEYDLFPVRKDADTSKVTAVLKPIVDSINKDGITGFYQNYSFDGIDIVIVNAAGSVITGSMTADQAKAKIVSEYKSRIMGN